MSKDIIGMYMQFLPVLENKTRTVNTSEHTEMSRHCFTCIIISGQHSWINSKSRVSTGPLLMMIKGIMEKFPAVQA